MPDREFDVYRTLPAWKVRITLAPTIPREFTIERTYRFQPERCAQFSIPTLLLLGGEPFLTNEQKRDILYHNAVRFLRLEQEPK